jgi:hypothetical protein
LPKTLTTAEPTAINTKTPVKPKGESKLQKYAKSFKSVIKAQQKNFLPVTTKFGKKRVPKEDTKEVKDDAESDFDDTGAKDQFQDDSSGAGGGDGYNSDEDRKMLKRRDNVDMNSESAKGEMDELLMDLQDDDIQSVG